jgi:hypothetical protein
MLDPQHCPLYVLYPLVAGSRKLYGGDLESAVSVMRTVAGRIRALPEAFHKKEAYIQVPSYFYI